jgi:hypothetical protein
MSTEERIDLMREILDCQCANNCKDCNCCNQLVDCQLQKTWEDGR